MDGIAFRLMETFWKDEDGMTSQECYLGLIERRDCTFKRVISFMKSDLGREYKLIFLGALMETPERRGSLNQASASIVDDELVIVRRRLAENMVNDMQQAFVLMKPFDTSVWLATLGSVGLFFLAAVLLVWSRPFRKKRRGDGRGGVRVVFRDGIQMVSRALVVVFRRGDWDDEREEQRGGGGDQLRVYGNDIDTQGDRRTFGSATTDRFEDDGRLYTENLTGMSQVLTRDESGRARLSWRLGFYKLIKILLGFAIALFFTIFILFYNAALTNFLFQENQTQLDLDVTKLTDGELQNYTVLRDSAAAETWSKIQYVNTLGYTPWKTCENGRQCLDNVLKSDYEFLIVQHQLAKYKAISESVCSKIRIIQPDNPLYRFNAGFLYGPSVRKEVKKGIDLRLLTDRMADKIRQVNEEFFPLEKDCFIENSKKITWKIFIVPFAFTIIILVLVIVAAIALIGWKLSKARRWRTF